MTSGAQVQYHLRAAKTLDRNLFVELLRQLGCVKRLNGYVYASMGGYSMADHHRIHRVLGLRRLFCFDEDRAIVRRQEFNRPIRECVCVEMGSDSFVEDPGGAYKRHGLRDHDGQIVWLDYTRPSSIGKHVGEFVKLLAECDHGDIVRLTLNANEKALRGGKQTLSTAQKQQARWDWLLMQVGQYVPEDTSPLYLASNRFPPLLARIIRAAAADALGNDVARPLSLVRYADGHQMFAATIIVDFCPRGARIDLSKLSTWPLFSRSWSEIHQLRIATLTPAERALVYKLIPTVPPTKLAKDLPFNPFDGVLSPAQLADHLTKYYDLLRFYPEFLVTD